MGKRLDAWKALTDKDVPRKRSECVDSPRPCPWVRCKHHMVWGYIDLQRHNPRFTQEEFIRDYLKENDVADLVELVCNMEYSCTLDITDMGEATLQVIGTAIGLHRERVRQIIDGCPCRVGAVVKLKHPVKKAYLKDFTEPEKPFPQSTQRVETFYRFMDGEAGLFEAPISQLPLIQPSYFGVFSVPKGIS